MIGYSVLRIVLAVFVSAHGWARIMSGAVEPFGQFLDGQGFPFGLALAWSVTAFEILGSLALITGRHTFFLCLGFSFIYLMGIWLVHLPEGWFVVGLGRNGMEYSVLLIVCFLIVGMQDALGNRGDSQ